MYHRNLKSNGINAWPNQLVETLTKSPFSYNLICLLLASRVIARISHLAPRALACSAIPSQSICCPFFYSLFPVSACFYLGADGTIVSAFRACSSVGYLNHLNDCFFPFSQLFKGYWHYGIGSFSFTKAKAAPSTCNQVIYQLNRSNIESVQYTNHLWLLTGALNNSSIVTLGSPPYCRWYFSTVTSAQHGWYTQAIPSLTRLQIDRRVSM